MTSKKVKKKVKSKLKLIKKDLKKTSSKDLIVSNFINLMNKYRIDLEYPDRFNKGISLNMI